MPEPLPAERYPGYDVLAKRRTPSWNDQTRRVIDERLAVPREPRFFNTEEFSMLEAIAARLVPQPADRPPVPVAALVDHKLCTGRSDGYRVAGMPREREAWQLGLEALQAEATRAFGASFPSLPPHEQDELLTRLQRGDLSDPAWQGMPPNSFFKHRLGHDIVLAYYSHPTSWSELGWGGPASPRGYVRMGFDRRDPWEAVEVKHGDVAAALRQNRDVR